MPRQIAPIDRLSAAIVRRSRGYWGQLSAAGRIRLLFAAVGVVNLVVLVPAVLLAQEPQVPASAALLAMAAVVVSWLSWVGRPAVPIWVDLAEMVALFVLGLGIGYLPPVLGAVFPGAYLRSLYGSLPAVVARNVGYLVLLVLLSRRVHAEEQMLQPAALLTWVGPTLALNALAARVLLTALRRVTDGARISGKLADAAGALLLAPEPERLVELVEDAARAIVGPAGRVTVSLGERRLVHAPGTAPGAAPGMGTWTAPGTGTRTGTDGGAGPGAAPPQAAPGSRIEFPLADDERCYGVLTVDCAQALPAARIQALGPLASQATAALQALELRTQLAHRAGHDPLTGLPNRSTFAAGLRRALCQRGRSVAVLFIDLDDFKAVNDSLGHTAGDALLVEVANRLAGCVRSGDLAARLGGDEFGVLLEPIDTVSDAVVVARRIIDRLDEPVRVGTGSCQVRCSIGVATARSDPALAEQSTQLLLHQADVAMYAAKGGGKNRFEIFVDAMVPVEESDHDIRERIIAALARGEFELYFQPVYSLTTGRVDLVEALLRWRHPQRGLLGPAEFLALAERVGALMELERWVIATACRTAAGWPGEDPPAVSFNISPRHLARSWLVEAISDALQVAGLPGGRLLIEITEESMVVDPAGAEANLRACAELGVRAAVDDFGAGSASLRQLSTLRMNTIKIDHSLVQHDDGAMVVRAVVELAHALGLDVVAEGVEEPEQLAWLQETGCDAAQGYLLARPLTAGELIGRLGNAPHPALARRVDAGTG